ncbi:hypothetical protein Tco_0875598 [Tanacetum coccineum]|uniref:Uncharacterized protein n=1 Tax=Tanacetum coccineum TaxID=301880 RepID=A0ABQ5BSR8_9ASTR
MIEPFDVVNPFNCDVSLNQVSISKYRCKLIIAKVDSAKELEDNEVLEKLVPLTDVGFEILVYLDSVPRGKLTFVFTFPILDLGIWIVDSEATVLLWCVAADWFTVRLGSLVLIATAMGLLFFNQSQHTPKPPLDEEDSSLDKILDDLFRIRAENIKKIEREVPHRCDDITDYEDSDHDDGELPDLSTFSAINKFASVCEHVKENIDANTARELQEVQVKDVEMDKDYDIYHSNTEETLQWSLAKDPFLVLMEPKDYFEGSGNKEMGVELVQVDAHGVVLGLYLATGKHFKSGLVGYQADDDDGLFLSCGCCSWKQT